MKKKYLKPEAEYISLEAEDIVTDDFMDASMRGEENEDDWV